MEQNIYDMELNMLLGIFWRLAYDGYDNGSRSRLTSILNVNVIV